jgi:hypothetical protein
MPLALAALLLPMVAAAGYESGTDEEREQSRYARPPVIAPRTFSSDLPLNPVVQALVDSVSVERIQQSVLTMIDFHTRNSASDTTSLTTGTGATRNWANAQFATYSAAHGGAQDTGFWDFTQMICNLPGPHRNVVAEQTGSVYPDRYYLIGAHYDDRSYNLCDATGAAPGADDNATGCATTLEIAYLLGQLDLDSSLIMMLFAGEEQGSYGSNHFAENALVSGLDIQAMISVDGLGNITGPGGAIDSVTCASYSEGHGSSPQRQFTRYLKLKGEAYQPDFEVGLFTTLSPPGWGSDHVSFHNRGFPATWVMESYIGRWHTPFDTLENMSVPYCARICRVNVAALASLLMAPLPPAGTTVANVGDGTGVFVSWEPNGEADLAGYRVAFRHEVGDSLYYQDIFDAGLATSYTIEGLTEGRPILVSVSAYDDQYNESVFGDERRIVPSSLPAAPANLVSTSHASEVDLDWEPNTELDVTGYNLYRSTSPSSGYQLLDFIPQPLAHYVDNTVAAATLYYYTLRAIDGDLFESPDAGPVKGRLVDHALDILIVDATPDGVGGVVPIDEAVDLFYDGMLSEVTVVGQWDRADSVAVGNQLSDADLGAHRMVVYHVDATSVENPTQRDTMALRRYLQHGGKLLLSGSQLSSALGGITSTQPIAWQPGDFMHDVIKSTETRQSAHFDMGGAYGQLPGYPDLDVDENKILFNRLTSQDAYTGPIVGAPITEVLYHYQSFTGTDPNHDLPDAIRYLTPDLKLVAFSFPLYYMDSLSVRQTIATALEDLGEGSVAVGPAATSLKLQFGLGAPVPNPFNPATSIEYVADQRERLGLRIYDVQGRLVRTLLDGVVEPGRHVARWNGRNDAGAAVGSGVYFVELAGPVSERSARRKLVMIR